ncbi:MAG: ABC transporter permease [Bacillota bacterium]
MLRRILYLLRKDLAYTRAENIIIYAVIAPILLAAAFRILLPSFEEMEVTFAVDASVPAGVVEGLEEYGRVQRYPGLDRLRQRVLEFDDVAGIHYDGEGYRVLLEGNEVSYVKGLPGIILDRLAQGQPLVSVERVNLNTATSLLREYGTAGFIFFAIVVGGMATGLSVVDDREARTMRALAVSPLATWEYLIAKALLGGLLALVLSLVTAAIIAGPGVLTPSLLGAVLSSLGLALLFGMVIGLISSNQLTAVATLKVLGFVASLGPAGAIFLPARLQWLMFPFPSYWCFVSFQRLLVHQQSAVVSNLLTILGSLVLLGLLVPGMRRVFRLG